MNSLRVGSSKRSPTWQRVWQTQSWSTEFGKVMASRREAAPLVEQESRERPTIIVLGIWSLTMTASEMWAESCTAFTWTNIVKKSMSR